MTELRLTGINLGMSVVHIAVYSLDGEVVASGEAPIEEHTTVGWERAVRKAVPELPSKSLCSATSTSASVVLADEYGEPVFQPQMYHESRPAFAEKTREKVGDNDKPGWDIALSPSSPLPKILHLRETRPDRFSQVEWILSPTTWLLYRLRYGSDTEWRNIETDWTNALKFGTDITPPVPEWFDSLFDAVDLPLSLLPTIRPPGSFIGIAEGSFARRTGFEGLQLFQGLTDGSAFVLANGCFEPGDFSMTFGDASVVKYVSDSVATHDALYSHRHPIEGYLPGAAFESGELIRWFCDRVLDTTTQRGLELAMSAPTGEEYEVFLPGNHGPFFEPDIGGSILGLQFDRDLSTDEVHSRLARGLAAGIALAEGAYISLIEDHFDTRIDRIRLMNNGAPTPDEDYSWWNRLRTSIWDRPVLEMEQRTTAGLLIPAALITSTYEGTDEASERLLRQRASVDPSPEDSDSYYSDRSEIYLDRWREIASLYGRY